MSRKLAFPIILLTALSLLGAGRWWTFDNPYHEEYVPDPPEKFATDDPHLKKVLEEYETYLLDQMGPEGPPALAVGIVKGDEIVYLNAFGVKEVGTRDSVDVHTVFRVASLSKGFAPVLAGMLVDGDKLYWQAKVKDYVSGFRMKSSRSTRDLDIRHVLSHTTGLPPHAYSNLLNMGVSYERIKEKLRTVDNPHQVGQLYNYQNVAYSLIGDVIEASTDSTYSDLMIERIYKPLGMDDASTTFEAIMANDNVALPHVRSRGRLKSQKILPNYYEVPPAAGVNASVADMAKWIKLLLGERNDLIADSTLNNIFTPQIGVSRRELNRRYWKNLTRTSYALGWRVNEYKDHEIIYHGGYVNYYRAEIAFNREEGIGLVVLCNAPARFIAGTMPKFFDLYFPEQDQITSKQ